MTIVEHSSDNGKTWEPCEPGPRSIVGWHVGQSPEGTWDDQSGHLYRWRQSDAVPAPTPADDQPSEDVAVYRAWRDEHADPQERHRLMPSAIAFLWEGIDALLNELDGRAGVSPQPEIPAEAFERFAATADPRALAEIMERATGAKVESVSVSRRPQPEITRQQITFDQLLDVVATAALDGRRSAPLGPARRVREVTDAVWALLADGATEFKPGDKVRHREGTEHWTLVEPVKTTAQWVVTNDAGDVRTWITPADGYWVRVADGATPAGPDGPERAARMIAEVQAEHARTWPSCATGHVGATPAEDDQP